MRKEHKHVREERERLRSLASREPPCESCASLTLKEVEERLGTKLLERCGPQGKGCWSASQHELRNAFRVLGNPKNGIITREHLKHQGFGERVDGARGEICVRVRENTS